MAETTRSQPYVLPLVSWTCSGQEPKREEEEEEEEEDVETISAGGASSGERMCATSHLYSTWTCLKCYGREETAVRSREHC